MKNTAMTLLLAAAAVTQLNAGAPAPKADNFNYHVDNFADIEVLRYQVPDLSLIHISEPTRP